MPAPTHESSESSEHARTVTTSSGTPTVSTSVSRSATAAERAPERPAGELTPAERDAARDAAIAKQRTENLEKDAKERQRLAEEDAKNVAERSKRMADPKGMEREIQAAQARVNDLTPAQTNPNLFRGYVDVGNREIARLRAHLSRLEGVVVGPGNAPGYEAEISVLRGANDALDHAQAPKP